MAAATAEPLAVAVAHTATAGTDHSPAPLPPPPRASSSPPIPHPFPPLSPPPLLLLIALGCLFFPYFSFSRLNLLGWIGDLGVRVRWCCPDREMIGGVVGLRARRFCSLFFFSSVALCNLCWIGLGNLGVRVEVMTRSED